MHDIWNPWHGCVKCSEGCQHCYMYFLDRMHDRNGADIYRTGSGFRYPLQKDRGGNYKIQSGELICVCMSSDFFLEQADQWRDEAWEIMRKRSDVKFFLLTKRPQRVKGCLPKDWGDGWENIFFNVTCENQNRADERIPIMLDLPFKHKGIMCAPFIGAVSVERYLDSRQIEQVMCGGENYDGARPCNFEWVKKLRDECAAYSKLFIEIPFPIKKSGLHRQPDGSYVRAFYQGPWEDICLCYQKIFRFAQDQGLSLEGFSYETIINETVIDREEDAIVQIEIPVTKKEATSHAADRDL